MASYYYYYLMAGLPALSLEGGAPYTLESFRALCAGHLSGRDARALDEIARDEPRPSDSFVARWRDGETQLRNALARIRATRLRVDAAAHLKPHRGFEARIEKAAADAMGRKTPLDRELALDQFRWKRIGELAGWRPFAREAMLGYALKLRLCARWGGMDRAGGEDMLGRLTERAPGKRT